MPFSCLLWAQVLTQFCGAMAKARAARGLQTPRPLSVLVASGIVALACHGSLSAFTGATGATGTLPLQVQHPATAVSLVARAAEATNTDVEVVEGTDASFQALSTTPVRRASDGGEVALPSLWSDGERVVVAFLRHFG